MTIRNSTPEESANAVNAMRHQVAGPYLAVLRKALDWCVENPDLFSMTAPALDAEGNRVLPLDPAAVKFCFFGRIAVEAGIKLEWTKFELAVPGQQHAGGKLVDGQPLQDWLLMIDVGPMDIIDAYDEDPDARAEKLRAVVENTEAAYAV